MNDLGIYINHNQTPSLDNPEGLGAYLARCIIDYGLNDGANEGSGYANSHYQPVNLPLNPQSGNPLPMPEFLGAEWGRVEPFALTPEDSVVLERDNNQYRVYFNPGAPAQFANDFKNYAWGHSMVAVWSSHLDPSDNVRWDISPISTGASASLPDNNNLQSFYRYTEGGTQQIGRTTNPITNQPYLPNNALRGDFSRVSE